MSGCQTASFYTQSVVGHSKLMLARQPIEKVIKRADAPLVHKLQLVQELKLFANSELALPNNKSYSSYVALERDYPVWVVVAAKPFSLQPKQWCYLVIGCAAYRGYFSKNSANKYAGELRSKGWEVYVGGAIAYSTLGWFADPLLPTMMRGNDSALAELMFHELAHQRIYVKGDSHFNEALATVVGERGALRWLQTFKPNSVAAYLKLMAAQRVFSQRVTTLKLSLQDVYRSELKSVDKIESKKKAIETFRQDYERLKQSKWAGNGYFDHWVAGNINNAKLAAFSTYYEQVPEFEQLLDDCDQNFKRFFETLDAYGGAFPEACL